SFRLRTRISRQVLHQLRRKKHLCGDSVKTQNHQSYQTQSLLRRRSIMPFSQDNPILPVKRIHIRVRLAELGISQLYTNEDIDNALAKVDQNAIYDAERAKIQIEIWDKQTPINDKPANVVLDHLRKIGNWPEGGEIYLLKKNGAIVYMQ